MLITFCRWFISTLQKDFEVLRFLSGYLYGIKVSEIVWLISTLSANLYADYFLQMIYFDFWGLKVSDRILVSSRENKVSEIVGQISLQYVDSRRNTKEGATNEEFEIATNGPNVANCSVVKDTMEVLGTSSGQVLLRNWSPSGETVK